MPKYEYVKLDGDSDADALGALLGQCFFAEEGFWDRYRPRLGDENFRVLRRDGGLVGGLGILFMGQWFGGRSVPTGGIAAVGVPPEERGAGAAEALMTGVLRELRDGAVPVSTLYPSNLRLYRKVGYEQAGSSCTFAAPASLMPLAPRDLPARAVDPAEHEVFHDMQRRFGERSNGNLARNRTIWEGKVDGTRTKPYAYLIGPDSEPTGYVVFHQKPTRHGFDLIVRDMAALTPAAWRRLFTLFADHRSLAKEVFWDGPSADPRLGLLPDVGWRVADHELWMLRITDVAGALTARGYPAGVEAGVGIEVEDDVIPENSGKYRLMVQAGAGEVREAEEAGIRLHVRALAPLYSGLRTATELRALGVLDGDDEAVAAADRIFAGPEPWMPDHF